MKNPLFQKCALLALIGALLLIPLSVLFVVVGGVAFFWAANRRQFDNVDAAAFLPMIDSDVPPAPGTVGGAASDTARRSAIEAETSPR